MKPTKPMIALKPLRYSSGRINVGDLFHPTLADARLLAAIGKARDAEGRPESRLPPPPAALMEKIARFDADADGDPGGSAKPAGDAEDLAAARADYFQALGKRPFAGWSVAVLREKIAAAAE